MESQPIQRERIPSSRIRDREPDWAYLSPEQHEYLEHVIEVYYMGTSSEFFEDMKMLIDSTTTEAQRSNLYWREAVQILPAINEMVKQSDLWGKSPPARRRLATPVYLMINRLITNIRDGWISKSTIPYPQSHRWGVNDPLQNPISNMVAEMYECTRNALDTAISKRVPKNSDPDADYATPL